MCKQIDVLTIRWSRLMLKKRMKYPTWLPLVNYSLEIQLNFVAVWILPSWCKSSVLRGNKKIQRCLFFCSIRKWVKACLTIAGSTQCIFFGKTSTNAETSLKEWKTNWNMSPLQVQLKLLSVPVIRILFRLETNKCYSSFSRATWQSW